MTNWHMAGLTCSAFALAAFVSGASAQETLVVGSTPTGVPFTFLNVETNQIDGVMVDIIEAIGEAEGFTPEMQATQWSALIPSLTGNKIDIIAAAMYATPERAQVVAFSETVYSYGEGLFVPESDEQTYETLEDLAGKIVGVQVGTAYVEPLNASGHFREVRVYDSISDIMRDVSLGRIDAGFGDRPIIAYQLAQNPAGLRLVSEYESQVVGDVAIAVRQSDTDLLARINDGLTGIRESGQLDQIIADWGIE